MKLENIKTLIFDFGNVLIDLDIDRAIHRLKEMMGHHQDFDVLNASPNYFHQYEIGQIEEEHFVNAISKHSTNQLQAADIIQAWNSMLIGIPKARLEMLLKLRESYQVVLLSNTNHTHIQWVREYMNAEYGVADFEEIYFDRVFYSYEMKVRKPDPAIFEQVLAVLGHSGSDALFFDDMEINVLSANRSGLLATYHDPKDEIINHLKRLRLYD